MLDNQKSKPQPIGDVLKSVVESLSQTKKKDAFKISSAWPSVAGKELCRHTRPVYLRGETLKVFVDDSAWFYQANLQKERLLKALRKKTGLEKIQKIQFGIGKVC